MLRVILNALPKNEISRNPINSNKKNRNGDETLEMVNYNLAICLQK